MCGPNTGTTCAGQPAAPARESNLLEDPHDIPFRALHGDSRHTAAKAAEEKPKAPAGNWFGVWATLGRGTRPTPAAPGT